MREIKTTDTIVGLSDLRRLGREGGATARLDSGEIATLKADYSTIPKKGIIAGQLQDVEMVISYPDLYKQIRTIQRHGVLVARRVKYKQGQVLRLTGKGYHRPKKD